MATAIGVEDELDRPRGQRPLPGRPHHRPRRVLTGLARRVTGLGPRGWKKLDAVSLSALGVAERVRGPQPDPVPYVRGETALARPLVVSGIIGFIGAALVLWGASQPTSPFTLTRSNWAWLAGQPPTGVSPWYFGTGPIVGHQNVFYGVVAVYAGMILMTWGFFGVMRLTRQHPGLPVARLAPVFVAWVLPLLVVAPLFSHDAYSYVGQGEQMTRHINPYVYGPQVLGVGGNPYASFVDRLWENTTSPYGPVFLWLAGGIVSVVNHNELAALVGFRILALFGVVLLAVFIPRLARSYGRDGASAFALVALNPIVLLHLVAGEHNDALMMGLLVAGLALARERHPIAGIVLCTLATLVKVPALVGVIYIGWDWAGEGVARRQRLRTTAIAVAISGAVMGIVTEAVGLGWGWVSALSNPDSVRSWLDPATALGLGAAKLVNAVGLGDHWHVLLSVARGGGFLLAAVIGVRLLLVRADGGAGSLLAIGLTMLGVVLLGPVVQPWYLVWGLVLLAPIAEARMRMLLVALSVVCSFLGLPGARTLVGEIGRANGLVIAVASAVIVAVIVVPLVPRIRRLLVRQDLQDVASGR